MKWDSKFKQKVAGKSAKEEAAAEERRCALRSLPLNFRVDLETLQVIRYDPATGKTGPVGQTPCIRRRFCLKS
jgi:hypothetical protein